MIDLPHSEESMMIS